MKIHLPFHLGTCDIVRAVPFKKLWVGMSLVLELFWQPPLKFQFFAGCLLPSFTFFVDFLLQKVQKYHPPVESQSLPDYPPIVLQKFHTTPMNFEGCLKLVWSGLCALKISEPPGAMPPGPPTTDPFKAYGNPIPLLGMQWLPLSRSLALP